VPHDPPQLLPGRTAKRDFVQFIVESFGLILAFLAGIKVLEYLLGTINGIIVCLFGLLGVAGLAWAYWRAGQTSKHYNLELDAGYVTFKLTFGSFGINKNLPLFVGTGYALRIPWDYAGIWVMDTKTGRPLNVPDFTKAAPGFYPSPHRGGQEELWTGYAWAGVYRQPGTENL
jgi:cbb3-type cytochrome oxidase subunit 3